MIAKLTSMPPHACEMLSSRLRQHALPTFPAYKGCILSRRFSAILYRISRSLVWGVKECLHHSLRGHFLCTSRNRNEYFEQWVSSKVDISITKSLNAAETNDVRDFLGVYAAYE